MRVTSGDPCSHVDPPQTSSSVISLSSASCPSLYSLPFLIFIFQVIGTSQEGAGKPKLWAAET